MKAKETILDRIKEIGKLIVFFTVFILLYVPYFCGIAIIDGVIWFLTGRMYILEFLDKSLYKATIL